MRALERAYLSAMAALLAAAMLVASCDDDPTGPESADVLLDVEGSVVGPAADTFFVRVPAGRVLGFALEAEGAEYRIRLRVSDDVE